jgi:hypothetical protein
MQSKKAGIGCRLRKLEQTVEQKSWNRLLSKEAGTDCRAVKLE